MRVKVIGAVLIYNGKTYHEGDDVEIEDKEERQILIRERCVVESVVKSQEKRHYAPSDDAIEERFPPVAGKTQKPERRGGRK